MNPRFMSLLDSQDAAPHFATSIESQVLDKPRSHKQYVSYMLSRTNTMFDWANLPPTIPAYMLELYLQIFGYAAFVEVQSTKPLDIGKTKTPPGLYIFFGGIGGECDIYYRPKLFTVANPRVKNSIQSLILYPGDEFDEKSKENSCVVMPCDHNYMGLLPLFNRYASQLVENDISIRSAQINARALTGISAATDRDKETARKYFDDLEAGKMGIIAETAFMDGVQIANVSTQSSNTIIQLIELQQYLKASWYNDLGLNVNFNMKREYMSEEEIAVNTDILLPLVDDMLECRVKFCELVNSVFGTDISVEKSSAWANKEQEDLAALSQSSNEGKISLSNNIEERMAENGTTVQEEVQANVPEQQVQSTEPGAESVQGTGSESALPADGAAAENAQNVNREPPVVEVDVNVNINPEGGEEDDSAESEASEESEEPDSERRDS